MKTKFNILCGLMVLAIIGAMTTIGGAIGKEDVDDFKEGYEQGWESAREADEADEGYTYKWQYLDVIPDKAHDTETFYNARTGEGYETHVGSKHITVKVGSASKAADA
jgi:hypothetical protein